MLPTEVERAQRDELHASILFNGSMCNICNGKASGCSKQEQCLQTVALITNMVVGRRTAMRETQTPWAARQATLFVGWCPSSAARRTNTPQVALQWLSQEHQPRWWRSCALTSTRLSISQRCHPHRR
jgi:hypothetical protein